MAKATPAAEQLLRHSNEPKDAEDTDLKPHCVCLPSAALDQLFAWDTAIKLGQSNVKTAQERNMQQFQHSTVHLKKKMQNMQLMQQRLKHAEPKVAYRKLP